MAFRIEALPAKYGDCLFLTFGNGGDRPTRMLVDGGPPGVFNASLKNRLREEQQAFPNETPLKLDVVMVSHIDQDHIFGIIQLLDAMRDADDQNVARPYRPIWLLHNGFDAILGEGQGTAARDVGGPASLASFGGPGPLALAAEPHPVAAAVLQSYNEALKLGSLASVLQVTRNPPDQSLLTGDRPPLTVGGATLRILGPLDAQIEDFRKEWHEKLGPAGAGPAALAQYLDDSIPNLASIVALLEHDGTTVLLTGDARGDVIIEACKKAGLITNGKLKVDVLKVPHHGSERDLETSFFEIIQAKHYIISANGKFGNPDRASLEMLEQGTGNRKINVYLTVAAQDCDTEHEDWRRNRTVKYDPAIHAITPIIQSWQQGNRITVSDGTPIRIDF
jgi:hypothetical protein